MRINQLILISYFNVFMILMKLEMALLRVVLLQEVISFRRVQTSNLTLIMRGEDQQSSSGIQVGLSIFMVEPSVGIQRLLYLNGVANANAVVQSV